MRINRLVSILSAILISFCVGCGGGSSTPPPPPPAISVSISPTSASVGINATQTFTATVNNSTNQNVTWNVNGVLGGNATVGTIDTTGKYTAPAAIPSPNTVSVTATSVADPTKTSPASTVTLTSAITVAVSPTTASLRPGQAQTFTATVTNSTNQSVTWNVNGVPGGNATVGTINVNGTYTPPTTANPQTPDATVPVTATSVADPTKTSPAATVTLLSLSSLTITPRGPSVSVAGQLALSAIGTFSDGTKHDWTAQTNWSVPAANGIVTVSGNTISGVSQGVSTVTATYQPTGLTNAVTNTTAVNVTNGTMSNSNLSGHYAFSLTHTGVRGQAFEVGSFDADGAGSITGGRVDMNGVQGGTPSGGIAITAGSYTVFPDGRGTLIITTSHGTDNYAMVLSNNGVSASTKGKMILSSAAGIFTGTMELQTTFGGGMSGNYALMLGGMDGALSSPAPNTFQNPMVLAGQFTATTPATISGSIDVNDNGTFDGGGATPTFTATYTAPDGDGRGTMVLTPSPKQGTATSWTFAYYVVSDHKVFLIQTDVQGTPPTVTALAGTAEKQTFSANPSIAGSDYVFLVDRSDSSGIFGAAGQLAFASGGVVTGEMDVSDLITSSQISTATFTLSSAAYTLASGSTGRGTLNLSSTPLGSSLKTAVFYLISDTAGSGKMYVLESDTKANSGVAEQQNTPGLLTGTLAFSLNQLATAGFDLSFSGVFDVSSLTGIVDSNVAANCTSGSSSCVITQGSSVMTGSLGSALDVSGRGTATLSVPGASTPYGYYVVRPTSDPLGGKIVIFGFPVAPAPYQAVDGVMENQ